MKKLLAILVMLAAATTLFAETVNCESEKGKCTYKLTDEFYSQECTCRDGMSVGEDSSIDDTKTLPTADECEAELEKVCQNAGFSCENAAGDCHIEQNGDFLCRCKGVWSANGAVEGGYHGTTDFSEESCNSKLVELCGTEPATVRSVCDDDPEILNACASYVKVVANTCYNPLTDEEIEAILDLPADSTEKTRTISGCCQFDDERKEYQSELKCFENCNGDNCCETCLDMPFDEGSEDGGKEEGANTEAAADDSAPAEDTADGDSAPATDSEAESKEESKSDGCSMLFV